MPRLYVNNASYPELREIGSAWDRHCAWWRAFRSAACDPRFWLFALVEGLIVLSWLAALAMLARLSLGSAGTISVAVTMLMLAVFGFVLVTWGGDLIRPHMRRTSATCRDACPGCGHQLTGHLQGAASVVRCPECGAEIPRETFEPPFVIPCRFLALGHWWRSQRS